MHEPPPEDGTDMPPAKMDKPLPKGLSTLGFERGGIGGCPDSRSNAQSGLGACGKCPDPDCAEDGESGHPTTRATDANPLPPLAPVGRMVIK